MINNISEVALRSSIKIEHGGAVSDKQVAQPKVEEVREVRPVENTGPGDKSDAKDAKENGSSKYLLDDNKMVFEKYNKDGDLIFRLPPSRKPIDERA